MPKNMMVNDLTQQHRGERGAALVSVLLISLLLLSAGGALILTSAMSATNSVDSAAETQAYYAAQSGLQSTLNVLRGNVAPNPLFDTSSSTADSNKITFRKAVTASTSNLSGDTNGPRLSRWLAYDSTYNDRVVITSPYSPINGLAYSTSITDPDNSTRVIFSTSGAFDNSTATKSYGNGNSKVTVAFSGQTSTTINGSGSSTLGSFTISGLGSQNYTIPANETFRLTITQTSPWSATTTINCTLSGTISSGGGQLTITFPTTTPTNTNNLSGTKFFRTTSQFNLPSGTTSVPATVISPEPTRLLVKVTGYGPRSAKKQMQMLLNQFAFDYTAVSTITLRSADDNSTLTFNAGSSAAYGYSGFDNAGSAPLSAFAVTSSADYNYLNTLSIPGSQVVGSPSGVQQVSISSLPAFLQTADAARAMVSQLRTNAQNINRYYTTASQPPDYGTTSDPVLTFVDGDTDLPPSGGAGLLIVTGTLSMRGSSDFHGLVLVLGDGQLLRDGGGNGGTLGSVAVARFGSTGNFLAPTFNSNGSGTSATQYDSDWVRRALAAPGPRVMGVSEY